MSGLRGARVALLEGRMSGELAALVSRHGGQPYCVPAVREVSLDGKAQVERLLDGLAAGGFSIGVFLTGAGVRAAFAEAQRAQRDEELRAALAKLTLACRGPKPVAALRAHGLAPQVVSGEPHTAASLLSALGRLPVDGPGVFVVHHGERDFRFTRALASRGAKIQDLCLYGWLPPEDTGPLKRLVGEIIQGEVDAVAFTSQAQARHLFEIAEGLQRHRALAAALSTDVVAAAVGPACALALQEWGVAPHVVPAHPKMGHLVTALASYLEQAGRLRQAIPADMPA